MPDDASLNQAIDAAVISAISISAYEALISIQQQHPELLTPGYREATWSEANYRDGFMKGLSKKISQAASRDAVFPSLREYLGIFLLPGFFDSPTFIQLDEKIRQLIYPKTEIGASGSSESASPEGIAILLLDVENLQLDEQTEEFLQTLSQYPITFKFAFAHWSSPSMHGQDSKFDRRNYELRHVPQGENSADIQMSTYGASILMRYANAKEVLVCSSDQGLLHLCNVLHSQGLTVYRVSKKGQVINILNKRTGETSTNVIQISLEKFLLQIKSLLKEENKRSAKQWLTLSKISQLYKQRFNLFLSEAVFRYSEAPNEIDFFINNPNHFAIHRLPDSPEVYVSLFNRTLSNNAIAPKNSHNSSFIEARDALEEALVKILDSLTVDSPGSSVALGMLANEFSDRYGHKVTDAIEKLQLKGNFREFLQSSRSFRLEQKNGAWQVALAND